MIAAAFRLQAASHDLWRRVSQFHAELLGIDWTLTTDDDKFDAEYYRQRMAEVRQRERERRMRRIAEVLASQSGDLVVDRPIELDTVPGLTEALDGFVNTPIPLEVLRGFAARSDFDLEGYQQHIVAHLGRFTTTFDAIPALIDNSHRDRIFRFIAMIFLAHAGRIELSQEGDRILMRKHEAYQQGRGVRRTTEEAA